MWTTTTTTAASVALVTAVSMAPAPQEAAVSIAGAETARDRAALKRPTQLPCLLACCLLTCCLQLGSTFLRFHFHRYDHLRAPTPGRRPPQRSPSCQHTPARQETRHGPNTRITQHLQAISALISSVCCVGRESGGPRPSPVAVMHQEVPLSRAARAGPAQTPAKASRVGLKRLRSGGMPPTNSGPQMRRTCTEMATGRQPPG